MDYIDILNTTPLQRSWGTIGAFDGVHLGHQTLFKKLTEEAKEEGCQTFAITFDPLPALFFKRIKRDHILSPVKERVARIKAMGIHTVIVLPFDQNLANVPADVFMSEIKRALGLEKLLTGFNFTLGKDHAGTVSVLKEIGHALNFELEVLPPVRHGQEIISSSNIRKLLKNGEVAKAALFLGRPYALRGRVVHGEHRGSKIGFPTANLAIAPERLLPANGVYAAIAHINQHTYTAVTNIGVRPTFENSLAYPRVEPYLLDTNEQFYWKTMTLEFIEYLRPEIKFPNSQALTEQIQKDILRTKEILHYG